MNKEEFVWWLNDLLSAEKEYLSNYSFFGFRFVFSKYSPIFKENKIYPIYPWKEKMILNLIKLLKNWNIFIIKYVIFYELLYYYYCL